MRVFAEAFEDFRFVEGRVLDIILWGKPMALAAASQIPIMIGREAFRNRQIAPYACL